jgi:cation/acetate symporter
MSLPYQYRPVNPRLGTHYATFTSAMIALVLVLAMLEQLGVRKLWLSHVMIAAPLIGYAGVAAITRTLDLHEFFSAGRRVPAVFGGLSLAVTAIGGTGFFALTGCLYLIGFDALALALGWAAGFAVCVVAFTPFLRKSGAYTLPGFFRQRFDSPLLGALAALALVPPAVLILAAEIRIGAFIASLFVAVPFEAAVMIGAGIIAAVTVLGGMRSVSWTQCILYIVVIGAFLVPLTILSVQITNLPLPQFTYGGLFEDLYRGLQLSYHDDYGDLSPGNLAQLAVLEGLCEEGIQTYDMGQAMDYKSRWADEERESIALIVRK